MKQIGITVCPECGEPLKHVCTINGDLSESGRTERFYSCCVCGSAWMDIHGNEIDDFKIEKYYIG